jgi:hypothetical protein
VGVSLGVERRGSQLVWGTSIGVTVRLVVNILSLWKKICWKMQDPGRNFFGAPVGRSHIHRTLVAAIGLTVTAHVTHCD